MDISVPYEQKVNISLKNAPKTKLCQPFIKYSPNSPVVPRLPSETVVVKCNA